MVNNRIMRVAEAALVAGLCVASLCACSSEKDQPSAQKPVQLTAEQQNEMRELEGKVKLLEQERAKLSEEMPSMAKLAQTQTELEARKNRLEALTQRDKVVPCLVAELARIVSEGTSIDVVEIAAEGIVIEMPVADGSKFEPPLNGCGAIGTSKKIDGGWAWEAKLRPVEPPPPEKPTNKEEPPAKPPPVSVLGQLPKDPLRRLESLRTVADAIANENKELEENKLQMDRLVEQRDSLLAAERSLKQPPDVDGTVEAVKQFGTSAGIRLKQVRPESGNTLIRIYVEMEGKLLDIDTLFVKLQTKPSLLVVETLVLKPGNGAVDVPVRMTLASPRI